MFIACSVVAIIGFLFATVVLPFRFAPLCSRLIEEQRARILTGTRRATFEGSEDRQRQRLILTRIWGVISAVVLLALVVNSGTALRDHPGAAALVVFHALLAGSTGGVLVLIFRAFRSYLPTERARAALSQFGFKALWAFDWATPLEALRECLAERIRDASLVAVVDVTGFDLLGKGSGPSGGILYDTLTTMTGVRGYILLLQPGATTPDPEQRQASVYQTVLAEMDISPQTYVRRIRATVDAIEALNESRPAEAQIEVRFYNEKPSVRAVIFDDSLLVSPWVPREASKPSPVLEVTREAAGISFYSTFRFHFNRLWVRSIDKREAASRAAGFKSARLRRPATAESA